MLNAKAGKCSCGLKSALLVTAGAQKEVLAEAQPFDIAQTKGVFETGNAIAGHGGARTAAAEDLWSEEKCHAVSLSAKQKGGVDLATALDEKPKSFSPAQLF